MQFLIRNRVLLTILVGIIAVSMLISLIFAIMNGSKERIIGSAIVLGLSSTAILCILKFCKKSGV